MTDLDLIKDKIDLVDYIGRVVPLKKAGTNWKGVCPFHQEKTPSFMVSPEKGIWHCFGCARGGDIFKFVMERDGVEFVEALQMLAETVGITLSKAPQQDGGRKTLLAINELATKYFAKVMTDTASGRKAKDYLVGRGLHPTSVDEFRIGYAPNAGKSLVEFLQHRGHRDEDIERAGLATRKGRFLQDKFVGRIMFPLFDALGRVVAFTGRVLDAKQQPKYLNSPETPLFHKSDLLYGLHLAKTVMQQENSVVVVEGQMDVISSHQVGVKNTIGISGTALTQEQLKLISRYANNIVLALDADTAGGEATKRGIALSGEFDLNIKIALLGDYKDPDSMIKDNPDAWKRAIEGAVPVMDFYFDSAVRHYDLRDLAQKKQATRDLLGVIVKVTDPMERDHYIKRLGQLVGVEPTILYDVIKRTKPVRTRMVSAPASTTELHPTWVEERAVALPFVYPAMMQEFMDQAGQIKWASGLANSIYSELANWYTTTITASGGTPQNAVAEAFSMEEILARLSANDRTTLLELMLVVEQSYVGIDESALRHELLFYLDILQKRSYASRRHELVVAIAAAEAAQDQTKLKELLAELNQLSTT
ncbi:DNA primase [candidate division Kazan bacterium RIFCSPHIGHO2_01_FULL_44_14]|uniref:DNA primase n=1 Tax=candidate division Kazan bacterium RIFCSPLOWO2_01_FULL_45_19 TaxID=1798538 RepID=A0A1F4NQC6_UNCK3|nr:hypothetical protein [uncultured bacterium]AQS31086.1 hypothetical protein [uncultured bacterium]OGB73663.1 MAG: DNA primase [candidate division Kazan bacterium RIFCSPLOWO2_01_FULL_45_19]OGB77908.1 MAG: DNA primase [candidate division Kazan bacterium RIFCSPHIGHO2_01_FULL_44_14]